MGLMQIVKRALGRGDSANPIAPSLMDFLDDLITPADMARRYGPLPKSITLLKYFLACTEASTCAVLKSQYMAQFTPRMYRRGSAPGGAGFKMRAKRVTARHVLKRLKDANPTTGVGTVARYASNAGNDIYEVVDHPWLDFYAQPNPYEPAYLFWQMNHLQRQIFGNAYDVFFFDPDGLPEQARHIAAQHVRIVPSKDNLIESFMVQVPGNAPDYYQPASVSHLKSMTSVVDYFYGQSWMERCLIEMDLLISAKAVEKARFDKGLRSEFAILMPEYNPVQKEQAREEIDRRGVGVKNSGGYFILPGVSDIKPLTMNNRDMQYNEGMKRAASSVMFCAGVPEAFAAINSSNLAGGLLADGQFRQVTIQPELCNNAQQLTALCNRLYDHDEGEVWLAYDEIVNIGAEENAKAALDLFKNNAIRLDEVRELVKHDPIGDERGDLLFAELSARGVAAPLAGDPAPGGEHPITPVNQARADNGAEKPKPDDNNYKSDARFRFPPDDVFVELPAPKRKELPQVVVLERISVKAMFESSIHKSDSWEYPFSKKACDVVNAGVEAWWWDGTTKGHFDAKMLEAGLKPLSAVFQEGGQDGIATLMSVPGGTERVADLNVSFDVLTPEVEHYIQAHTIKLAHQITARKNADLAEAIHRSVSEGMNTQEATAEVQKVMQESTKFECERIARTESSNAYSKGTKKAWQEAKVERKVPRQGGGACELCAAICAKFAKPIPLDHVYFAQNSEMQVGSRVYSFDYAAVETPPFHPSCRCTEIPVLE